LKSGKVIQLFGVLITLLVSLSASYAADTSDSNSSDVSNQVMIDPSLSDDSGTDDSGNDSFNDSTDPVIYYAMDDGATSTSLDDSGNDSDSQNDDNLSSDTEENGSDVISGNGSVWGESSVAIGYSSGITSSNVVTTNTDPQNDKIHMQKTGIPILPAELGIISIVGGFMINRIR